MQNMHTIDDAFVITIRPFDTVCHIDVSMQNMHTIDDAFVITIHIIRYSVSHRCVNMQNMQNIPT
jgi:hypothetical protein